MRKIQSPPRDNETLSQRIWRIIGGDRLFFWSYVPFLICSLLSTSFYYRYFDGLVFMWVQIICAVMLGAYELRNGGFGKQNWIAFGIMAFMCLITWRVAEGNLHRLVTLMFLYIYCARRIPFAKIAKITLDVSIAIFALIVISGELGIIEKMIVYRGGRVREFMGFRYILYPAGILLNMTALWIYLKKDTVTIPGAIGWLAANFLVYLKTNSRVSFVLAGVLLVGTLLIRYCPKGVKKAKPLWLVMAASFLLCTAFSVLAIVSYKTIPWMEWIDHALGGRVSLARLSLRENGLTWFGQSIEWVGNGLDVNGETLEGTYNYVDCLYIKIPQRYGVVFAVLLLVLVCWAMWRLYQRREYHILMISAVVAAHCVLDDLSFALHYNTFWIALGVALLAPSMLNWNGKTNQLSPPPD